MSKALFVLLMVFGTGCATLFAGNQAQVNVSAREPGTPITVDGMPAGTAPGVVTVTAHKDHIIASQNGSCVVTANVGAIWVVLDILGGIVPLVVDVATGAWKNVEGAPCML